jgi:hypothetical protein
VAIIVALLVSSIALMLFDVGIQNLTALSAPVELNTELPGATGYCVYQLEDKSLVLNSANQSGTYLTKLDLNNHIIWTQLIQNNTLPRLVVLHDGGFLLGGIVNNRYVLVKTDSIGNIEWTKTLDSGAPVNYFMAMVESRGGGFAIAGFCEPAEDSLGWIWFAKTDSAGNLQWSRNISGPNADCPSNVIETSEGGYVLSDTGYSFVPNQAFFRLIKLDVNGGVLGNSSYGGYGYFFQPECNSLISTQDGGYLMGGYLWRKPAWVVKVGGDGEMQWNQTYGEDGCSITGALKTPNGYLLEEYLRLNGTGVILTDPLGNPFWNTTLTDVTLPVGMEANFHSIIEAKDGGYIMVASKNGSVWLAKFDYPKADSAGLWLVAVALLGVAAVLTVVALYKKKKQK